MIAARSGLIDFSLSIHGPDLFAETRSERLREKLRSARFARAISHFCLSQMRLHADSGDWDRFKIVRCGVNPERFKALPDRAPNRPLRVLCVGRLTPAKGQRMLLAASLELYREGLAHELVLVGDGPDREI